MTFNINHFTALPTQTAPAFRVKASAPNNTANGWAVSNGVYALGFKWTRTDCTIMPDLNSKLWLSYYHSVIDMGAETVDSLEKVM